MRRSRLCAELRAGYLRADEGSASLEFLTVGLILLVPLVYLVLAVSAIQGAAFAAEGAARQAARVFVQAPDAASAEAAAERALQFALADSGIDSGIDSGVDSGVDGIGGGGIRVTCSASPCLTRQEFVTVSVDVDVPLPLVPPVLALAVHLRATATEQVSRFWGSR